MAITVNWATQVINVPKADTTLVVIGPPEVRELNVDTFRLALKDLEDDAEGIIFLDTHQHNTEVTVAGTTLSRVVEIINGYTVTFEDGQYAVNIVGANSNLSEVTNVNQVSIRSFNTAGLITVDTGGGGTADWTDPEKQQIRGALGVTGTQATPTGGGQLQDVLDDTADLISMQIVEESTVTAGATTSSIPTNFTNPTGMWDHMTILVELTTGQLVPRRVGKFTQPNGVFYPTHPLPAAPATGARIICIGAIEGDLGAVG